MPARILSGTPLANLIYQQCHEKIQQRLAEGFRAPALAVILIGDDSASQIYVRRKQEICKKTGINSFMYTLPTYSSERELISLIRQLNADTQIDGILLQLPLPSHMDASHILEEISPQKDVDGFHPYNLGRLAQARPLLRPCTPYGIRQLLDHYGISLVGLHAVVVGASNIVGRPMALELLQAGCTVTICHTKTINLAQHVQQADVLISATGKRGIIESNWVKSGAIVVDVGIHRLATGTLCGDLDFSTIEKHAGWITPVPGGVGPMTVATLMMNTVNAAALQNHSSAHIKEKKDEL